MDYRAEWVAHPKMESLISMQENSKIKRFKISKCSIKNKNKFINAFLELLLSRLNNSVFNALKNLCRLIRLWLGIVKPLI
jgi:hypothetical protein